jgi:hypothetical protein
MAQRRPGRKKRRRRYQVRREARDTRTYAVIDTQRGTEYRLHYIGRFLSYWQAWRLAREAEQAQADS